jgi:hypothetical protein
MVYAVNSIRAQCPLVHAGSAALDEGWTVSISDLYAMGFDPGQRPEHFDGRLGPDRFDCKLSSDTPKFKARRLLTLVSPP